MASCGQLLSGSLAVRVRESALGQNVSTLEPSDQTRQRPGRGPTAESGGLDVRAAEQSRNELRGVKYAPCFHFHDSSWTVGVTSQVFIASADRFPGPICRKVEF